MSDNQSINPQTDETSTKERRDFLRNSVLAAGAVATLAVAESANAQVCYDAAGNVVKAAATTKVIDVTFTKGDIKIDDLYNVIKQLGGITGCLTCGLNGFDFHVHINPVLPFKTAIPSYAIVKDQVGF